MTKASFVRLGKLTSREINIFCLRKKGFTINELKEKFGIPERTVWNIINTFERHNVLIKDNRRFFIDIKKWLNKIHSLDKKGHFDIYKNLYQYFKEKEKITINGVAKRINISKDKAKRLIEELPFLIKKTDKKRPYYIRDKEKLEDFYIKEPIRILNMDY